MDRPAVTGRAATPSLQGLRVLVTGAARGIGADAAVRLAARGARPALVGLEPEVLASVAARCGDAPWFDCDVTDAAQLERAVQGTLVRLGGLDAVVANAGIAPVGMVRSIDPAAFERTLEVNLLGTWRTVRACLPHIIATRGYVLVVASLAAIAHGPGMAAYTASKAGAEAFADCLRLEVRHLGVDVGVAYFSWIATDMVASADRHPLGALMRTRLRGPLARRYPVSVAGEAIERGIERRARYVVVPGWIRALLLARGLITPLGERLAGREAAEADALFADDVRRRGEHQASAPVGPGGAAASHRSGEVEAIIR